MNIQFTDNSKEALESMQQAAGGTVVLQCLPHELVGHYFTEVT